MNEPTNVNWKDLAVERYRMVLEELEQDFKEAEDFDAMEASLIAREQRIMKDILMTGMEAFPLKKSS